MIKKRTDLEVLGDRNLTKKTFKVNKKDLAKYWDKDYINEMIGLISNFKHRMLVKFLWMTGVRVSEAVNLCKGDIDFSNYVMTVKWLKSRKYNFRNVPLHPSIVDVLELYTASMKDSDRVFPITRQRVYQITMKYLGGSPHQLRHSFAVNWLRCDGDLVILHRVLGHAKIQTTMEYLKIVPVDQGKELLKIDFV